MKHLLLAGLIGISFNLYAEPGCAETVKGLRDQAETRIEIYHNMGILYDKIVDGSITRKGVTHWRLRSDLIWNTWGIDSNRYSEEHRINYYSRMYRQKMDTITQACGYVIPKDRKLFREAANAQLGLYTMITWSQKEPKFLPIYTESLSRINFRNLKNWVHDREAIGY